MLDSALASAMLDALRPPPMTSPSEFAEANIRLPSNAAARPGPLRLAPYQIEPLNHFADDDADVVVLEWAAQTGKSTIVNALLGHTIGCNPGPTLHVSPTGDRAKEFVRERLDPIIASSPALRALVGTGNGTKKGSAGGTDSTALKTFPGGLIAFASSHKKDELAARAIKCLLLDETDRFVAAIPGEGDPVSLALKRTKTFEDNGRRVLLVSTPTTRMGSRIDAWFKRGDQRRWYIKCTDCDHESPLDFADIRWTPGQPDTAYHACPECGVAHDERQRRTMVECGRWVATATGEKGIRSYHLTELSSIFSTMASVVRQFEAAVTPEEKQTFYNTTLAQAYDASTEVELSASELQQRAEKIAPPYAPNLVFISAGVDVQSDRLECTFLGHHADQTLSVLNHLKLPGDTSGDAVWQTLDAAMASTFLTTDGRTMPVLIQAVDSGFNADQVVKFVLSQRRRSRAAYAVKGKEGFDRMPLAAGGRLKGQMKLLLVGVDAVKLAVQKALAIDNPSPGYIRLPDHLDEDYFAGLASEQLHSRVVRGAPRYAYHRTVRRNEPLDCLVYAWAIARHPHVQTAINKPPASAQPKLSSIQESARRLAALSQPMR
ncbi:MULTISPECIES: terminase gpA endonuclease subunit [unclassified Bradyrhizobium]|uniref:phage terminase large subunit family protein n=1 Tax=unclassified Bradyrhizobium TaxID=2631580 RepID=UPI001FF94C36|nr:MULTISPECIES: terminase gpA endonuclease subunit [unclassified Bradyrhizobium]MCK1611039.1 phage terminase large subunit family protein [Bradyrhizobium sp. 163]MCK1762793.1 phage terminase large subunit family protein [Bradyrhizobium sp. 136]